MTGYGIWRLFYLACLSDARERCRFHLSFTAVILRSVLLYVRVAWLSRSSVSGLSAKTTFTCYDPKLHSSFPSDHGYCRYPYAIWRRLVFSNPKRTQSYLKKQKLLLRSICFRDCCESRAKDTGFRPKTDGPVVVVLSHDQGRFSWSGQLSKGVTHRAWFSVAADLLAPFKALFPRPPRITLGIVERLLPSDASVSF